MSDAEIDQHHGALLEGTRLGPRIVNAYFNDESRELTIKFDNESSVVLSASDIQDLGGTGRVPDAKALSKHEITGDGYYLYFPLPDIAVYGPELHGRTTAG
jgi:hypothetical protein